MEHRSPRTAAGGLSQRQGMGILFGVYLSFGLSPLYWNLLHGVSALEMVSHRSLWGSLIIAAFMVWKGQFPAFFRAIDPFRGAGKDAFLFLAFFGNKRLMERRFVHGIPRQAFRKGRGKAPPRLPGGAERM